MSLTLYAHPFSSYCQKALIAFYENDTPFTFKILGLEDGAGDELAALWPMKRFPVLVDGSQTIIEASIIIEHLHVFHPGPVRLLPDDPAEALEVRTLDRVFDNYVQTPQQKIVFDAIRPSDDKRDPYGVADARASLETIYAWLDSHLEGRTWVAGKSFSMADCSAAPALFYADWTHPIPAQHKNLHAYRARLLARPSFARAVDGGRPYRAYFPLGAPDRD
ncbi:glutathione S-transferase family protein [Lacibacterium aquatile]|uniref:Glutathione S-transferase family protein n=1 Tax=Lacibacterium aquatile TaxID=1168082 RepID=A0ABW5DK88_9PROT